MPNNPNNNKEKCTWCGETYEDHYDFSDPMNDYTIKTPCKKLKQYFHPPLPKEEKKEPPCKGVVHIGKYCDFCRPVSKKGWEEEFDKRFFNPAIPNPSELKNFIKKLYPKQKLQHGRRLQKKDEI